MENYVKFLKKLFFQNVLVFIIFFIDTITPVVSSTQIACDAMCVQHVIQSFLHSQQKKNTIFFLKEFFSVDHGLY